MMKCTIQLSEVEKKVLSIAGYLASIGFKPGDVLQMGCSNHVHFYLPVLAAWMLGGTCVQQLKFDYTDFVVYYKV